MNKIVNTEFQKFINASANSKVTTNNIAQEKIAEGDFYRTKYANVTQNFEKGVEVTLEEDWEEKIRRENAETERDDLKDILNTRKSLKWILLAIIIIWLIFVAIVVILQGFNVNIYFKTHHLHFRLADSVMNMLLGTTTASVFGLYKAVTNYFFGKIK